MFAMPAKVGRFDVNAVPMTKARPKLTEIVDDARDRGVSTALTEYGRPRAFVVSVTFFETAATANELMTLMNELHPELLAELWAQLPHVTVPPKIAES
jgi:prevent-host-death family protein